MTTDTFSQAAARMTTQDLESLSEMYDAMPDGGIGTDVEPAIRAVHAELGHRRGAPHVRG